MSSLVRFNNGILGTDVESKPGETFDNAADAERAARAIAASSTQDAAVSIAPQRDGSTRFQVSTLPEVDKLDTAFYASNQLGSARDDAAAFYTGTGSAVRLRGTSDKSSAVEKLVPVFEHAGLTRALAEQIVRDGVTQEQAVAYAQLIATGDIRLRYYGETILGLRLLTRAAETPGRTTPLDLARDAYQQRDMAVVRPDGYVAALATSEGLYKMGEPQVDPEMGLKVRNLPVGQLLYGARGGVFRTVNPDLTAGQLQGERPLEGALGSDLIDGVAKSVYDAAVGVIDMVKHPIRTAQDLSRLPANIVQALKSTPAAYDQFMALPGAQQERVVGQMLGTGAMLFAGGLGLRSATGGLARALEGIKVTIPTVGPPMAMAVAGGRAMAAPATRTLEMSRGTAQAIAGQTTAAGGAGALLAGGNEGAVLMAKSAQDPAPVGGTRGGGGPATRTQWVDRRGQGRRGREAGQPSPATVEAPPTRTLPLESVDAPADLAAGYSSAYVTRSAAAEARRYGLDEKFARALQRGRAAYNGEAGIKSIITNIRGNTFELKINGSGARILGRIENGKLIFGEFLPQGLH